MAHTLGPLISPLRCPVLCRSCNQYVIYQSVLFPADWFLSAVFPEQIFEILNDLRNEANGEPTRLCLICSRTAGVILMLIGIATLAALILRLFV